MEFLKDIKDSVETSVFIKLFPSLEIASYNHIFYSHFLLFPISNCITLQNFNYRRLSTNPYPEHDLSKCPGCNIKKGSKSNFGKGKNTKNGKNISNGELDREG